MRSAKVLVLTAIVVCLLTAQLLGAPWTHPASGLQDRSAPAVAVPNGAAHETPAGPAPAAPPRNITTANVTVTTALSSYTVLAYGPVPVQFQLTVANATITPQNVTLWVDVTDAVTSKVCENLSLESLVTNDSNVSQNASRVLVTSFEIGNGTINATAMEAACPTITSDAANFVVGAKVDGNVKPFNGQNVTTTSDVSPFISHGTNITISTTPGSRLIFGLPTETLNFGPAAALQTYNMSATYTGQYVGRVALTVYSASEVRGTRSVLLSANLAQVNGKPAYALWYEPRGGVYPYTLQLFTPYDVLTTSGVLAVTNTSSVYYNTTNYDPQGIGGLSPAASAAMLLVVGLVVGFLVMFAVSRWMRPPSGEAAPKQWSGTSGTPPAAGGAQTCTFCGRSFPTPEELAAHAKSEHGVE